MRLLYAADLPIIASPDHGDYAELATLLKQERTSNNNVGFIFGGASLAPSPLASFDSGSHIIDILNLLSPDVMGVTKREFSYFEDELILRSYEASFPLLLSNAIDLYTQEPLDGIYAQLLVSKGNVNLGFISILAPQITEEYLLQRISIHSPQSSVERRATVLREEGADVIILLHSDAFDFIPDALNKGIIDLAIQSDPNNVVPSEQRIQVHPNQITIDKVGYAAVIDVQIKDNGQPKALISSELKELASYEPDPSILATLEHYQKRLESQLSVSLATVKTPFSTRRNIVRLEESGFGNFIADALRNEVNSDIAIINGGVIRGEREYLANYVFTQQDLLLELPFRARLVVLNVTGEDIKQALENGVSQYADAKGRFPQVSGIRFSFSPNQPIGQRTSKITINNEPIDLSKTYVVATTDYLHNGGDGYTMFKQYKRDFEKAPTSPLIADIVARTIKRNNNLTFVVSERIIKLDK
ncbi:bifunctional metallophosphatase/5'-nucleotidase [Alteromonas facilis]|uniref:bifunctional metallophosphatase/5'-nucleotidase n=1 Tax=Alteromonas facilis TaxID=2048004 RepID=UPI0013DCCE19|nr:5'-nucleotidase C-terminal domain-containing protein [Alteromonas facilis]